MLSVVFGKRYEHLLLFTAPITLAAIAVFLVAFASTRQRERVEANCYAAAADQFERQRGKLSDAWEQAKPATEDKYWGTSYMLQLKLARIDIDSPYACYDLVDEKLELAYRNPPGEIINLFRENAKALRSKPLSIYGIELPHDTSIDLFGTKVKIDLMTLVRILQVVLLPVIAMWLGSLYSTRYREALLISKASTLAEVFPHVINMYPAGKLPSPRKRDPLAPYARSIWCFIFSTTRLGLLSIFILPPVLAYVASLFFMAALHFSILYLVAGITVSLFALTNFLAEFVLAHSSRVFTNDLHDGGL